jgi:hypothetical protein
MMTKTLQQAIEQNLIYPGGIVKMPRGLKKGSLEMADNVGVSMDDPRV